MKTTQLAHRQEQHQAATAQLLRDAGCRKEWFVILGDGRVYLAYTYPDSALLTVTNLNGRPVRGVNVTPECGAAIAAASANCTLYISPVVLADMQRRKAAGTLRAGPVWLAPTEYATVPLYTQAGPVVIEEAERSN